MLFPVGIAIPADIVTPGVQGNVIVTITVYVPNGDPSLAARVDDCMFKAGRWVVVE